MMGANTEARLVRLERRHLDCQPSGHSADEAMTRAWSGNATALDFEIIQAELQEYLIDRILVTAYHYQLAHAAQCRLQGWGPRNWAAQIISVAPNSELIPDLREYLAVTAAFNPKSQRRHAQLHPHWAEQKIVQWIDANLLVPILEREEDALRARLRDDPPNIDWWPNRYDCDLRPQDPDRAPPKDFDTACPADPNEAPAPSDNDGFEHLTPVEPDIAGQVRTAGSRF